ncbi:uncharacterized protein METZ01_LOCUS365662, partial [marine metagenome]
MDEFVFYWLILWRCNLHMKKYVVSILTFMIVFGFSASNIGNMTETEAAGNYQISEIKYIANECTNIGCTDENLVAPPLMPGSLNQAKASGTQNFNQKIYGN